MELRIAKPDDAPATAAVHARSIRQLCAGDYSPQQIDAWTSGIHEDSHRTLIGHPELKMFIACEGEQVLGFVLGTPARGVINALYVAPEAAHRGVGTRLLTAMEEALRGKGVPEATLNSSLTSVSFYRSRGYRTLEPTVNTLPSGIELPCVAMSKALAPDGDPLRD